MVEIGQSHGELMQVLTFSIQEVFQKCNTIEKK